MTRDEIIRMGIDSGLYGGDPSTVSAGSILVTRLKRFYDLSVAAEREACAIAAWSAGMAAHNAARGLPCDARDVGSKAANAIRARSNA
jgi:hypothetical protein